jgi:2-haloacid dehalogenase
MSENRRSVAIFDLGGVLIDWNPRYLYRKLFNGDEAAMEHFLANVCTQAWNEMQDAGRPFAEACAILKREHHDKAELIDAWTARFGEMLAGPIQGTVDIMAELRARGVPLFALTNWSAETYPLALERFDFLGWFRGVLVSGQERMIKPDPRIYRLLLSRFEIDPASAVYIDDNPRNAAAADAFGLRSIHFTEPEALRRTLRSVGLL